MNIGRFLTAMNEGVVNFIYIKLDGSLRTAKGTTNLDFVPEECWPNGNGFPLPEGMIRYFDVDKEGWRTLKTYKLLWTMQQGLVDENIANIMYGGDLEQDVMDLANRIVLDYEARDREENGPTLFD